MELTVFCKKGSKDIKQTPSRKQKEDSVYIRRNLSVSPKKYHETPVRKNIDKIQLDRIPEKKQKKKKKKTQNLNKKNKQLKNYLSCLKNMKPVNLQKQYNLFYQNDCKYNPLFIYNVLNPIPALEKQDNSYHPHEKYLPLAIKILQKYVALEIQQENSSKPTISIEETSQIFNKYIQDLSIKEFITYQFQENTVSPTRVVHNNQDGISRVIIGLPLVYKSNTIMGVLNHQIGTHFIRKYNDKFQKWYKDRKKYSMSHYLKHQQGLAALNQLFQQAQNKRSKPLLYRSALHYYSCFLSGKLPFCYLYKQLQRFVKNPTDRWKECIRVKRGITDTSAIGGMYKDQIYLRGAISILKKRNNIDFISMHCGKLTIKDCIRLKQKGTINSQKCKFAYFLKDYNKYISGLSLIAKQNFIDQFLRIK